MKSLVLCCLLGLLPSSAGFGAVHRKWSEHRELPSISRPPLFERSAPGRRDGNCRVVLHALAYFGNGGAMDKRLKKVEEKVDSLCAASAMVLIDGDNLRAAFGWRISPEDLAVAIDKWAETSGFSGRLLLTYDHGREATCFLAQNIAVQVSGPRHGQSADDAIAKAAAYMTASEPSTALMLVTSDRNLAHRVRLQQARQRQRQQQQQQQPEQAHTDTLPSPQTQVVQALHFRVLLEASAFVTPPQPQAEVLQHASTSSPCEPAGDGRAHKRLSVPSLMETLLPGDGPRAGVSSHVASGSAWEKQARGAESESRSEQHHASTPRADPRLALRLAGFVEWANGGCRGLQTGEATRKGLVLYSVALP